MASKAKISKPVKYWLRVHIKPAYRKHPTYFYRDFKISPYWSYTKAKNYVINKVFKPNKMAFTRAEIVETGGLVRKNWSVVETIFELKKQQERQEPLYKFYTICKDGYAEELRARKVRHPIIEHGVGINLTEDVRNYRELLLKEPLAGNFKVSQIYRQSDNKKIGYLNKHADLVITDPAEAELVKHLPYFKPLLVKT